MNDSFLERTSLALGKELMSKFEQKKFCVVGCGGTGALFAEMLVRTGALTVTLIDEDDVEASNLNRVVSFVRADIGKPKVKVLKSRLESINPKARVTSIDCYLGQLDPGDCEGQRSRDAVCNSDIAIIAVDENRYRIECEKLCRKEGRVKYLGIGVYVDEIGSAGYECYWSSPSSLRETPEKRKEDEGYGRGGSYAAIVIEATSVAFSMLLHHLKNPSSRDFCYFFKSYKNFAPRQCQRAPSDVESL